MIFCSSAVVTLRRLMVRFTPLRSPRWPRRASSSVVVGRDTVTGELIRSRLEADRLLLKQREGFLSANPAGRNAFGTNACCWCCRARICCGWRRSG